jgi:hypothetical protein
VAADRIGKMASIAARSTSMPRRIPAGHDALGWSGAIDAALVIEPAQGQPRRFSVVGVMFAIPQSLQ